MQNRRQTEIEENGKNGEGFLRPHPCDILGYDGGYRHTRFPESSPSRQLSCRHLLWCAAREHPRKREHLQWGTLGKSDAEDCG